jgi:Spy/CpxP family protein refolding chaperone
MDNSRFLKIVIIVLLIINIATLAFMWMQHAHHGPDGPARHDVAGFLEHELKFTDEQRKQFDVLMEEHHEQIENIQHNGRELHNHFFDLLNKQDSSAVKQLADSLAKNQEQIELITFDHFKKVRAICTPEQQKKFDEIIDEALRMMAQHQGPPPR